MRSISNSFVRLAACAAFVAASVPLAADHAMTLKGEVVDQACYTKDKGNVGEKHKDCGLTCAKKGSKLAFVTSDGQVYTIVGAYTENKNAKLIDLFAMPVEATGEVAEKDGAKELKITALKKVS
jgi:type 1 fimbria pilin